MVRRGSTVRVRQRALQKRCTTGAFPFSPICCDSNVRLVWSRLWSFRVATALDRGSVGQELVRALARAVERSAGRRGGQLGEQRGLPLERLLGSVEGIAVGQLAGVEVADMRPVGVLPDPH